MLRLRSNLCRKCLPEKQQHVCLQAFRQLPCERHVEPELVSNIGIPISLEIARLPRCERGGQTAGELRLVQRGADGLKGRNTLGLKI